jgi:CRP-like cAMP-binding protein
VANRRNRLLTRFPSDVREQLASQMRRVDLPAGHVLHRSDKTLKEVYFPLDCVITVTTTMADTPPCLVSVVGNREMVGLTAFMGGRELNHTTYRVQVPGWAVRVPADLLLDAFDANKGLRHVLLRYAQSYMAQLSLNAVCNARHLLSQRLARWLVELSDRSTCQLSQTHQNLADLLAVRRPSVTEALAPMQKRGLLSCEPGTVTIHDIDGLKQKACECYRVLEREYNRLLGRMGAFV